jgi:hypothetical protein
MSLLANLFETECVSLGPSISRNMILLRNARARPGTVRIRLYTLLLASLAVLLLHSSEKAGFQLMTTHYSLLITHYSLLITHHSSLHELLHTHPCQNVSDVYCTIFTNRNVVGPDKLTVVVS